MSVSFAMRCTAGLALVLAIACPASAGCPPDTMLTAFFSPPTTVTQVDSVVTVALAVDSTGVGFNGYTVTVTYDPSIVEFQDVEPGPAMMNPCGSPFETLETSPGEITYTCIILCSGVGVEGPGDLCLFTFRALALGQTFLRVTSNPNCTFFDDGVCVGQNQPGCPREVHLEEGTILVTDGVTGTGAPAASGLPSRLVLSPNPTAAGGTFAFRLAGAGPARLELFDAAGRRLLDRSIDAGPSGTSRWDGRDASGAFLASGRYYARVTRRLHTITSPVVVLR